MKRLFDGVRRYQTDGKRSYVERFGHLASGQSPHALFITCADSRLVPNIIASTNPGELFVVRNVANLVPVHGDDADPSVAAAVAYAVDVLQVRDIVVCGHSSCGGMKALLDEPPPDRALQRWLDHGRASVHAWRTNGPLDDGWPDHDQLSQSSTLQQIQNLRSYPAVARATELTLHAWWFDIRTATVLVYDDASRRFVPALEQLARTA